MPFKNKGRMLQAYRTLIGSRGTVGLEFEFAGTVSIETTRKFVDSIYAHSMFRKYVVEHNMGYDGMNWFSSHHDICEKSKEREYRIQFYVNKGFGWCYLLEYILMLIFTLGMKIGSIHLHLNSVGYTSYRGIRRGKACLGTSVKRHRIISAAVKKTAAELYGTIEMTTTRYRYKADSNTPTLEIRTITPTVFYPLLLMEILYWEQVLKELQDKHRRTRKKLLIVKKYKEFSSREQELLGCHGPLFIGPMLQR